MVSSKHRLQRMTLENHNMVIRGRIVVQQWQHGYPRQYYHRKSQQSSRTKGFREPWHSHETTWRQMSPTQSFQAKLFQKLPMELPWTQWLRTIAINGSGNVDSIGQETMPPYTANSLPTRVLPKCVEKKRKFWLMILVHTAWRQMYYTRDQGKREEKTVSAWNQIIRWHI